MRTYTTALAAIFDIIIGIDALIGADFLIFGAEAFTFAALCTDCTFYITTTTGSLIVEQSCTSPAAYILI
jgi:hypothetical protein